MIHLYLHSLLLTIPCFSGIVTGVVKVYEGYVPGGRSPNSNATVVWSSVHGKCSLLQREEN